MITAHIKSPKGDRTEEWEDGRIKPDEKGNLEEFNAYVIGSVEQDGTETLAVIPHYFWDLYEEVGEFITSAGGGNFPKLTTFMQQTLQELGDDFKGYLELEKRLFGQQALNEDEYDELYNQVDDIRYRNTVQHLNLSLIVGLFPPDAVPVDEPERVMAVLLKSMYDFTVIFFRCIQIMDKVLKGLKTRAEGGTYTPLNYVNDIDELRNKAAERQQQEQSLTKARNEFNAYLKQPTQPNSQTSSPPVEEASSPTQPEAAANTEQAVDANQPDQ